MSKILKTADDVTDDILQMAEDTSEWFDGRRIDWDEFWDRLCGNGRDFDILEIDTPACRKIQKHVRAYQRGT